MKGTIEEVWQNESRNGQKYLTVQVNGERYSVWDAKYFDQLEQGVRIEGEVKQSGKFKHLAELRVLGDLEEAPSYRFNGSKDAQIARMSCLKSASEIVAPIYLDVKAKRDLVVETAKHFERYVLGDDLMDFPPKDEGDKGAGNSK